MIKVRITFKFIASVFVLLTATSFVLAQTSTRTWVSETGDDANACSRTTPCATFAGALAKTSAGGEIDVLDPGDFGEVSIDRSITIDGGRGRVASVIAVPSGAAGVLITSSFIHVVLRNIELTGVGIGQTGIAVARADGVVLTVENCTVSNFTGIGIDFEPNEFSPRNTLIVSNTSVRDNAGGGIVIAHADASLSKVWANSNTFGVKAIDGARVSVRGSDASGNTTFGFAANGTSASVELNISDSSSTSNGTDGVHSGSGGAPTIVRIANVLVTNNAGIGLASSGGGRLVSFTRGGQGTNNVAGNIGGDVVPTATSAGEKSPPPLSPIVTIPPPTFTQLAHILHMGQSLGSGDDSFPAITTADSGHGNFQFSRGVHTWREGQPTFCNVPELRPDSDFALVPITAGEPIIGSGETIASGLVDQLKVSIGAPADVHFLFSFSGQGSKRLRNLDKQHDDASDPRNRVITPGGYYPTSIDDVRRGLAQARAHGWSYSVPAITWMQGEKNNDLQLDDWLDPLDRQSFLDAYATEFIALKNDWNNDILPITGQASRIRLFTYQTNLAVSGQAQLLASQRDPEIILVSPTYFMPSAVNGSPDGGQSWGNPVHINADAQRWLGEQFAKVIKRVLVDHETWMPLYPLQATLSPDRQSILIDYHVPRPPLVIDTTFLPAARTRSSGFFIGGGPEVIQTAVASPTSILLTLASPLPAGTFTVEYASEHGNAIALRMPSNVLQVRTGTVFPNGQASFELVFAGDQTALFQAFLQEGVFFVKNEVREPDYASSAIRFVSLDSSGNTVLKGEVRELRNGMAFQTGQSIQVLRSYYYGNIHDSDSESSMYGFAQGPRVGQPYPLWNWSLGFEDLQIK